MTLAHATNLKPILWNVAPHLIHPMFRSLWVGLVGYWPFWESGGAPRDISGYSNHGTISGAPTWTSSDRGRVLDFDGVNDLIDMGDITTFDGLSTMTISVLVNPRTLPSGSDINTILAKHDYAGAQNGPFFIRLRGTEGLRGSFGDGSNSIIIDVATIPANVWTLVTLTLAAGGVGTLYYDAIVQGTDTNASFTTTVNNAETLRFASSGFGSELLLDGLIGSGWFHNRALSPLEISLMHAYLYGDITPWWDFPAIFGTIAAAGGPHPFYPGNINPALRAALVR